MNHLGQPRRDLCIGRGAERAFGPVALDCAGVRTELAFFFAVVDMSRKRYSAKE
jgi:hypothetical protein